MGVSYLFVSKYVKAILLAFIQSFILYKVGLPLVIIVVVFRTYYIPFHTLNYDTFGKFGLKKENFSYLEGMTKKERLKEIFTDELYDIIGYFEFHDLFFMSMRKFLPILLFLNVLISKAMIVTKYTSGTAANIFCLSVAAFICIYELLFWYIFRKFFPDSY